MKWLLPLLFLSVSCAASDRLIFITDSLGSTPTSYPSYFEGAHVMGQPGRLIRTYQPPRDLHSRTNERIVYFLGGNDIGTQSAGTGSAAITKLFLVDHLSFLASRGFRVLVVIPPNFQIPGLEASTRNHRRMFRSLIGTIDNVDFVDINPVWNPAMTSDGLHPLPELSQAIADRIRSNL